MILNKDLNSLYLSTKNNPSVATHSILFIYHVHLFTFNVLYAFIH